MAAVVCFDLYPMKELLELDEYLKIWYNWECKRDKHTLTTASAIQAKRMLKRRPMISLKHATKMKLPVKDDLKINTY